MAAVVVLFTLSPRKRNWTWPSQFAADERAIRHLASFLLFHDAERKAKGARLFRQAPALKVEKACLRRAWTATQIQTAWTRSGAYRSARTRAATTRTAARAAQTAALTAASRPRSCSTIAGRRPRKKAIGRPRPRGGRRRPRARRRPRSRAPTSRRNFAPSARSSRWRSVASAGKGPSCGSCCPRRG